MKRQANKKTYEQNFSKLEIDIFLNMFGKRFNETFWLNFFIRPNLKQKIIFLFFP